MGLRIKFNPTQPTRTGTGQEKSSLQGSLRDSAHGILRIRKEGRELEIRSIVWYVDSVVGIEYSTDRAIIRSQMIS